ncbi:MAG TPA: alpha/beta hydrolase [Tepidisphaeraceae bacterium]|jgi:pimeloyl-ACP methyl ester carboxylesterase|nr:alpha/beta hydrolase [Tepidisphaeraceae bacterium]
MIPARVVLHVLIAASLAAFASGCVGDALVLGSNHEKIDAGKARRRIVHADGRAVECWVARSPGAMEPGHPPAAYVLVFIGKGDRADRWIAPVAGAWGAKPVELWGMNYPGSGGTDGPTQLSSVVPDALATYDAVRREAGRRPIFVQAGSFGTSVGLAVAARRPVAGLILQNPPPLRQLILGYYGWWNLWLLAVPAAQQIPPDLDSIANAANVHSPAVFILAGNDVIIPPYYHELVVSAYAGPKRRIDIPGGGHDGGLTREAAAELSKGIDWLWQGAGLR